MVSKYQGYSCHHQWSALLRPETLVNTSLNIDQLIANHSAILMLTFSQNCSTTQNSLSLITNNFSLLCISRLNLYYYQIVNECC